MPISDPLQFLNSRRSTPSKQLAAPGPDEATLPGKADDDLAVSETGSTGQEKPRSTKAEASDAENARASAGASGPEDVTADEKKEGASSAGSSSSASKTSPASSTQKTPGKK